MPRKKRSPHETAFQKLAEKYPDVFLACRDFGHSWKPSTAAWLDDGTIERTLDCGRCHTRRIQTLDSRGYIVSGHYAYPDHYLMAGVGRLNTDDRAYLRLSNVQLAR